MSAKGGFQELLFTAIMPKIYGIGAAIVIVGAMFKILHLPGAGIMLGVGLSTEAVIFFLSAFEPKHKDPDWAKVYPELADDYEGPIHKPKETTPQVTGVTNKMDKLFQDARVGPDLIKSLGDGMRNMAHTAKRMTNLNEAAEVTKEYSNTVKQASGSLAQVNKSYLGVLEGMKVMTESAKQTGEYQVQIQNVTKSLGALNAVYEMELKDAQSHTKALNKFYTNLTGALESMADAGKETNQFQVELNKLTSHISGLNKVYGNMLTAMRSGG